MSAYPGQDYSTYISDANGQVTRATFDLNFTPINTPAAPDPVRVVTELILRKLSCVPGTMDDENWGMDLRGEVGNCVTSADLLRLQGQIRSQVVAEEAVDTADVAVLMSTDGDGTCVVSISGTLADRTGTPFTFAFALNPAGILTILGVAGNQGN